MRSLLIVGALHVCPTGFALGVRLLGLPWQVQGIMLAGEASYYQEQQRQLTSGFMQEFWRTSAGPYCKGLCVIDEGTNMHLTRALL